MGDKDLKGALRDAVKAEAALLKARAARDDAYKRVRKFFPKADPDDLEGFIHEAGRLMGVVVRPVLKEPRRAPRPMARKASTPKASPRSKKPKKGVVGGSKAAAKRAAEGRRAVARGDRPPLREAMAVVMGDGSMTSADVVAALEARGWGPNADDPRQYISYMLSSSKDTFDRVERGVYRVNAKWRKANIPTLSKGLAEAFGALKRSTKKDFVVGDLREMLGGVSLQKANGVVTALSKKGLIKRSGRVEGAWSLITRA